jgi:hypothetical protein
MAQQKHKRPITDEAMATLRGRARSKPAIAGIDVTVIPPTVASLNSLGIFKEIRFESLRRRGSVIEARFDGGAQAMWRTATDLLTFARSQAIIFDATGVVIPTPSARKIRTTWEPIAQLLRRVSDQDCIAIEPSLKDEFAHIIRATWERAGSPACTDSVPPDAEAKPPTFVQILQECNLHKREPHSDKPPRCCVWIGEGACWIHQPSLDDWLSTLTAKNRHYQWDDMRTALLLLNFVPRELHRSSDGKGIHVRVWRGPFDLLVDDETKQTTNS